jgi:hypothetical protein
VHSCFATSSPAFVVVVTLDYEHSIVKFEEHWLTEFSLLNDLSLSSYKNTM